ncbi:MAG: hypothetical protein MR209_00130 [Veillonellaceae bacterium]|nr:hypothetical protein [Veillonellaceae bacterium]
MNAEELNELAFGVDVMAEKARQINKGMLYAEENLKDDPLREGVMDCRVSARMLVGMLEKLNKQLRNKAVEQALRTADVERGGRAWRSEDGNE